jgi:hypothetical protein
MKAVSDYIILHPEVYNQMLGLCTATLKDGVEYEISHKELLLLYDLKIRTDNMTVDEFEKFLLAMRI